MADAGWYNDESDPTQARWYDGEGWTDHVVDKAAWEAVGEPPPPPDPPVEARPMRVRTGLAAAAVMLAVVVGGVALADGGDDPAPAPSDQDAGTGGSRDDARDGADVTSDLDRSASSSVPDLGSTAPTGDPDRDDDAGETRSTVARSGAAATSRTTVPRARAGSGSVERTESVTRTRSNTSPITASPPGDRSSVGNESTKSMTQTTDPPPPTTEPPPDDPAPDTTTPTDPPPEEPTGEG